mgnify:CR=1 FL=1
MKNNPCLIGEPGVGKTAIANGLAIKIARQEVPAKLLNKEVYLLDMTAIIAGTQFRGQFEGRMKALIDECKQSKNIILVIDEIHSIIGTGDAEHSMNAANILKPSLANGEVQLIGTTTLKEYRKYIEEIRDILRGDIKKLSSGIVEEMKNEAANLNFEKAQTFSAYESYLDYCRSYKVVPLRPDKFSRTIFATLNLSTQARKLDGKSVRFFVRKV